MSYILNLGGRAFDLSEPVVMGILNVTPDSFYAGSRKQTAEAIAERTHEIVQEGGRIIDIGACSTRPGGELVDGEEELRRLRHALEIIRAEVPDLPISVDTYRADVAKACVEEYGVEIVNDISGGQADPKMYRTVGELGVTYILMHLEHNVEDAVGRVGFIHRGQAAGLTLAQIRQILDIRDGGQAPCEHVRDLLDVRLAEIEQQIAQLSVLRDTIADLSQDAAHPDPETCSTDQVCRYL